MIDIKFILSSSLAFGLLYLLVKIKSKWFIIENELKGKEK
jgi:hypothetical protein